MLLDSKKLLNRKGGLSGPFSIVLFVFFYFLTFFPITHAVQINDAYIAEIEKKYGQNAKRRVVGWQKFLRETPAKNLSEKEKLKAVNQFFNFYEFVSDISHWKKVDYWATPLEFVVSGGGDCEDFVIAKYFALRALGVAEEKLLITYVTALKYNQAHMVLTYYETPESVPLVLDNLDGVIKSAHERSDLAPVYNFNGLEVRLLKSEMVKGKSLGKGTDMNLWTDMLRRMDAGTIADFRPVN